MKKIKILFLIVSIVLLSGCVKVETSMDISKTGKVKISFINAVNESLITDEIKIDKDRINKLKENGFTVEEYQKDGLKGYRYSKTFSSINLLTAYNEEELNNELNIDSFIGNKTQFFTVEKGFFKNTYVAKISSSIKDDIFKEVNIDDNSEYKDIDLFDENIDSMLDLKFNVNLPGKTLYNNATETSNDGKTLTWDLNNFEGGFINFKFTLYNYTNIGLVIGSALLIIIVTLIIISKFKNNNKDVECEQQIIETDINDDNDSIVSYDNTLNQPQETITNSVIEESTNNDTNKSFIYPEIINTNKDN